MAFPFYHQHDSMDCGPACLQMIAKFYGKMHSLQTLREYCYANRNGVTLHPFLDMVVDGCITSREF